ncbi:MAG: hypothetical protein ACOC5T_07405 [Elusimicrobiota bacterium]
MYDKKEIEGICFSCGDKTSWYLDNRAYCETCMKESVVSSVMRKLRFSASDRVKLHNMKTAIEERLEAIEED